MALPEVNLSDADRQDLFEGDWTQAISRRGSLRARVQITKRIPPGTVLRPIHWSASQPDACEANRPMHKETCEHSSSRS